MIERKNIYKCKGVGKMDILPFILTEDNVKQLPDEILCQFASCATKPIVFAIQKYLENRNHDEEIAKRVSEAYSKSIGFREFMQAAKTKNAIDIINELSFEKISPALTDEELESYRDAIEYIMTSEHFMAYTQPIKGTLVKELITALDDFAESEDDAEIYELKKRVEKSKKYFKDSQFQGATGTPVKKIYLRQQDLEIILRGIAFLERKKVERAKPAEWRYI